MEALLESREDVGYKNFINLLQTEGFKSKPTEDKVWLEVGPKQKYYWCNKLAIEKWSATGKTVTIKISGWGASQVVYTDVITLREKYLYKLYQYIQQLESK